MKLLNASFVWDTPEGRATIAFRYPDCQPAYVEIRILEETVRFENASRRYKPCLTHAQELFRRVKPPKAKPTNFAKQRADKSRPLVRLYQK